MTNLKINFENRYSKLNDRQNEAVNTIDGPVLVVAGPGTGKTELLAIRAGNILKLTDSLPSSILLLTFTDSAAYNMRERLIDLIGEQAYRVGIYTFHSFASDILNRYPEYFFDGAKFRPGTEVDQINIIENIVKSLPRKNPYSSYHPELGYIFVKDIIGAIKNLKKGGYTPEKYFEKLKENKKNIKELNNLCDKLDEISGKRKFEEIYPYYLEIFQKLEKLSKKNEIAKVLFDSLNLTFQSLGEDKKSTPLTAWKNKYTKKGESGKIILKDCDPDRVEKLEELLHIYEEYQKELYKQTLYDFEDMIIFAGEALKNNLNLRFDLQEKFQFIMIDEFQDTNDAQFNLVKYLTLNDVNEGRPNVLAVGDDDQAIFKFQGAELSNIYNFINSFNQTKVIVLDKNYRSTQDILDFSRKIILKGEDRLEVRDKNIVKKLDSENTNYKDKKVGEIITQKFDNEILEFEFIAKKIKELISKEIDPSEIAIICRKHEQLKQVTNILNSFSIPYSYEKRENVLEKQHIYEITTILQFANLQASGLGDVLIPEILSFKFWDLDRITIWKIALNVRNSEKKISWLEAMIEGNDSKIKEIANFLISLSVKSLSTPLEYLIDEIVGTTEFLFDDNEHDDDSSITPKANPAQSFVSPYKKYYFNNKNFEHNKPEYLDFLFSLRTFIGALREFHAGKILYAKDIPEFLETYNGHNLTLSISSPFSTSEKAVSVLTAHKSKGLEFEYVFLLSADQETWKRAGFSSKIQFPINMQLTPDADNDDDKIRLLYVAITRAKHTLYITHNSHKLEYLVDDEEKETTTKNMNDSKISKEIINSLSLTPQNIILQDEKILLKRLLENYKMPVTHLNNFLNFTKVGPGKFIEQNLLRFPQAFTPSAAYGSAMHATIESYFLYYNKYQKTPDLKFLKDNFETNLERARLPKQDFKKYLESGLENLEIYIKDLKSRPILPNTKVETKFSTEGVMIGEVPATGNIDKMEFVGNEIIVTDLKTGEAINSWEEKGLNDYEKIKLHFFKYQLAYYALLIENSRTYNSYTIKVGNIEFIEAKKDYGGDEKIIILPFEIDKELKGRVKELVNIVYKKIQNLDFPDTFNYSQNLKGILQFEEDLLSGKV